MQEMRRVREQGPRLERKPMSITVADEACTRVFRASRTTIEEDI